MATETVFNVFPPPILLLDLRSRFEEEGSFFILVASFLFPTDVPPDPGPAARPAQLGGRADPGRRTAQIPAQVGNAQPCSWMLSVPGT